MYILSELIYENDGCLVVKSSSVSVDEYIITSIKLIGRIQGRAQFILFFFFYKAAECIYFYSVVVTFYITDYIYLSL